MDEWMIFLVAIFAAARAPDRITCIHQPFAGLKNSYKIIIKYYTHIPNNND